MVSWRRVVLVLVAVGVVVGLMTSYDLPGVDVSDAPAAVDGPAPGDSVTADAAMKLLRELPGVARHPAGVPQYDRAEFGEAWADVDGNSCNQRDDVLVRDAEPGTIRVQQQGRCPHDVLAGTWRDPYSGRTLVFDDLKASDQARALQIDHVVPLAEAWRSGAHAWSRDRREHFANDLGSLLAVDGPTNAAKGSDDPAAWRPRQEHQCRYAVRWIDVKHRWGLAADPSEVDALRGLLATC